MNTMKVLFDTKEEMDEYIKRLEKTLSKQDYRKNSNIFLTQYLLNKYVRDIKGTNIKEEYLVDVLGGIPSLYNRKTRTCSRFGFSAEVCEVVFKDLDNYYEWLVSILKVDELYEVLGEDSNLDPFVFFSSQDVYNVLATIGNLSVPIANKLKFTKVGNSDINCSDGIVHIDGETLCSTGDCGRYTYCVNITCKDFIKNVNDAYDAMVSDYKDEGYDDDEIPKKSKLFMYIERAIRFGFEGKYSKYLNNQIFNASHEFFVDAVNDFVEDEFKKYADEDDDSDMWEPDEEW